MKANELRIGNLVTVNNPEYHPKLKGVILRVTSISPNGDDYSVGLEHINQKPNTYNETYSQFLRFIEPIQLQKEFLNEKFKSDNGNFWIDLQTHYLELITAGRDWFPIFSQCAEFSCDEEQRVNLNSIQYLHHLQNLYYTLTGEELPVC